MEELKPLPDILKVKPTLRGIVLKIIAVSIFLFLLFSIYLEVPKRAFFLDTALGFSFSPLHILIMPTYLITPLVVLGVVAILYLVYHVVLQKTTLYTLNDLNLIKDRGVFVRSSDSIDYVLMQDQTKRRNLIEMILQIATVVIYSRDKTHPELHITGIKKEEADMIVNYLRKYAFANYTEYRIAKDKAMAREGKKPRNGRDVGYDDDGGDSF